MHKIVIIGPGALGGLLAARLGAVGRHETWLLDHDPDRAALLAAQGIILSANHTVNQVPIRATAAPRMIGPADLVLLCVKSRDVAAALDRAIPVLTDHSLLISFQNGIRHLRLLAAYQGPGLAALGVTVLGATGAGPGRVTLGGTGLTRIGLPTPARPGSPALDLLARGAATLNWAGLPTEVSSDILPHLWGKLLVNVGINALSAIHDCPNGRLPLIPAARAQLIAAVREAEAVARAQGIVLPADGVAATLAVCQATANNLSSMLQDVRRGRRTEIEAINGAVVEEARRLGLSAPVNQELVRRIRAIEKNFPDNFA